MTLYTDPRSQRLRWSGILAGLVMGAVTTMSLLALGTVVTSLTGLSLTGTGIQALIWVALSALAGAYAGGLTAVRASAPATYDHDAAMTHDDAGLTGLVTGGLLVLAFTWMLTSGIGSLLGLAGNITGAAASGAVAAGTAAGGAASQSPTVQDFVSGIQAEDIEYLIADNTDLTNEQTAATSDVVAGVFRRATNNLGAVNLTNVDDVTRSRVQYIQEELRGPQFVTRLEREGLTPAQAQDVQNEISQEVDRLQQQAAETAQAAEETARRAGTYAGLGWLIPAGLILLASRLGAHSAAGGVRPVRRVDSSVPTGAATTKVVERPVDRNDRQ
ncbi:hypothetical protein [Deinococcus radiophilus]|uniref:hypothetical protein n=2 Tax=Deinococcus radiophilus TaxID=32062 RepID=UPI001E4C5EA7|nr:hypothetical protein [Deinococcus radiophilus]UFA50913.1 hypothetical protein LMT64_03140 [Deinococcus radiophilus]